MFIVKISKYKERREKSKMIQKREAFTFELNRKKKNTFLVICPHFPSVYISNAEPQFR